MRNHCNPHLYPCLLIALVLGALSPIRSWAADLQVVCPGGGPGVYPSINAALSALDSQGPNSITVAGTCTENIFLDKRERLLIQAAPGQTATIVAAEPNAIVLQAFGSQGVVLSGLVLQGGVNGVIVNQGSNVSMLNCTLQQNSSDGLVVQIGSTLVIENSTIQNNGGNGMSVAASSNVTLATSPGERILVQGNSGDGIDVDGSYFQVNFGSLTVQNNVGAALVAFGGRVLIFGGDGGENIFQNNGEGIDLFNAASATFFGKNTIRANGDVGLQVLGSSVAFNGNLLPDGTPNATVIEGHATLGVNLVRMGEITFNGPHKIRNNGNAAADPILISGIRVVRGSLTLVQNPEVSGNFGPGIRAEQNSGLSLSKSTIVNNTQEGVRVTLQSEAAFPVTPFFSGNGVASISCDTTSLISGSLAGISNIDCCRIVRTRGPAGPGRIRN